MGTRLPKNFSDLEKFVTQWVFHSERERNEFRVKQELDDLRSYYNALLPRLPEISAAVDQYPLDKLPIEYGDLLALALMAMEVAPTVEYYNNADVPNAVEYERFEIYDTPAQYKIRPHK